MALLDGVRTLESLSDLYGQIAIAALSVLVISALARVLSVFIASASYRDFCREHTWFYREASQKLQKRTVYSRFPVPWASESTYFLLDHVAMRKLFVRSPKLDAFGLARRLHHTVWGVPPDTYRDIFRAAAKQIHKELSAKNLTTISKTFEGSILEQIEALRKDVGSQGRRIPLHSTFYRFAYKANMKAIFGPDLPVDETRVVVQNFAHSINTLYSTASLTVIPMSWRNKLTPGGRKGVKERLLLQNALTKWRENGGLETCSDAWRSIMNVVLDNNVDPVSADAWANMALFGFQGNTPEQPGWFWMFLLQSPKLLEAVKAEVAKLPAGQSLVGTDFRKETPLMHSAIHEGMRLSTAVFAGREATDVAKIPGCDETFPKGSLIRIMSRASVFDASVWGEHPECFKGDRFMNNTQLYNEEMVFGGGVSACPGRFFAQSELELLTAHLIRNLDFDAESLAMHERLAPDSADLEMGPPIHNSKHTCDIMDLDGTRIVGKYPGIIGSENSMEGISGSLFPLTEVTCVLRTH